MQLSCPHTCPAHLHLLDFLPRTICFTQTHKILMVVCLKRDCVATWPPIAVSVLTTNDRGGRIYKSDILSTYDRRFLNEESERAGNATHYVPYVYIYLCGTLQKSFTHVHKTESLMTSQQSLSWQRNSLIVIQHTGPTK
jgi:hypothetical protein